MTFLVVNFAKQVVGNFCNDLAMKKAQEAGIGWVVCRGKNRFQMFELCKSLKREIETSKGCCFLDAKFLV